MTRQARRDTKAEIALRKQLWRRGLRYRVDMSIAPISRRRVDIVFRRERVAIFVDGCFWHSCPEHATSPNANSEWWADKLRANVLRDRDTDRRLREAGWLVLRVWEHENPQTAADDIVRTLARRRSTLRLAKSATAKTPSRRIGGRAGSPAARVITEQADNS